MEVQMSAWLGPTLIRASPKYDGRRQISICIKLQAHYVSKNSTSYFKVMIMQHMTGQTNIVEFMGAFEDRQNVYLVMELCVGGELFDQIITKGNYTEAKAAAVCRDIVTVVHVCHFMGVMHRDLKPENFLLVSQDEDSEIKMIDFGLSVFIEEGICLFETTENMVFPNI
jgi:serine/threonine protein kinase